MWEGEIADPVEYNRFIGEISISGNSFEYGIIPVGSEILCDYTFSDSGNIETKVTVPSVGITETKDSYDRLSGQIDFNNDDTKIVSEAQSVLEKIEELSENIFDEKLDEAATKIAVLLSSQKKAYYLKIRKTRTPYSKFETLENSYETSINTAVIVMKR